MSKLNVFGAVSCTLILGWTSGVNSVYTTEHKKIVGGDVIGINCNMPENYSFTYHDCVGGTQCVDEEWRDQVLVPPFGTLVRLYKWEEYCHEANDRCDPHNSFEYIGDAGEECDTPVEP